MKIEGGGSPLEYYGALLEDRVDFIVTQPKSFDHLPPSLSPVRRAALHCCSDASVIWKKNQKQ